MFLLIIRYRGDRDISYPATCSLYNVLYASLMSESGPPLLDFEVVFAIFCLPSLVTCLCMVGSSAIAKMSSNFVLVFQTFLSYKTRFDQLSFFLKWYDSDFIFNLAVKLAPHLTLNEKLLLNLALCQKKLHRSVGPLWDDIKAMTPNRLFLGCLISFWQSLVFFQLYVQCFFHICMLQVCISSMKWLIHQWNKRRIYVYDTFFKLCLGKMGWNDKWRKSVLRMRKVKE